MDEKSRMVDTITNHSPETEVLNEDRPTDRPTGRPTDGPTPNVEMQGRIKNMENPESREQ